MKIALVHRYYPMPGGVTSVVKSLKEEFEKEHEVVVITNQTCDEKNVIRLSGGDFSFYRNASIYINENQFDIIHTHSFPMCYFTPFLKPKLVMTVHGFDKIYDKPKFRIRMKVKLGIWAKGIGYRYAHKIVAISNLVKQGIVDKDIDDDKIVVIPNAVNTDFFKPLKVKRNQKEFRMFINSTSKRKGFHELLSWLPQLIESIPNLKIVVVGTPDKDMDIPESIKNYFEFKGHLDYKEMPNIINSVDLVILPSIDEPFGLTALEGMACGKPVIVSSMSGVKDVIDGDNGLVSSLEDFPKNILQLAKDKELRNRMGLQARKTVVSKLSAEAIAREHINLCQLPTIEMMGL